MFQNPTYQGYIPIANGQPTLLFDTGFLVQTNRNAALCGWYAFRNVYRIGANVSPDIATGLPTLNHFVMAWDGVYRRVVDEMVRQNCERASGNPQPAGTNLHVLFDTPHVDLVSQASIYSFGGALMRPGDPGFAANFNAAYAAHALGDINGTGLPVHHPAVATQVGIVALT